MGLGEPVEVAESQHSGNKAGKVVHVGTKATRTSIIQSCKERHVIQLRVLEEFCQYSIHSFAVPSSESGDYKHISQTRLRALTCTQTNWGLLLLPLPTLYPLLEQVLIIAVRPRSHGELSLFEGSRINSHFLGSNALTEMRLEHIQCFVCSFLVFVLPSSMREVSKLQL